MSWYYNRVTGAVFENTGWAATLDNAEVKSQSVGVKLGIPQVLFGPFDSQAQAQAFAAGHPSPQAAAKQVINGIPQALTNFGNTVVRLETRGIEAVVGIVLLAIAANVILKELTGVDVAADTVHAGKKAAATGAKAASVAAV